MNHQTARSDHPSGPRPPRTPTPPPHPPSRSSQSLLSDFANNTNFGEDIDFVVGVTATALAADQLLKLKDSTKHKKMHLAKAGLSAAAAAAAFSMMRREHAENCHHGGSKGQARHHGSVNDAAVDLDHRNLCQPKYHGRPLLQNEHSSEDGRRHSNHRLSALPPNQETYESSSRHAPYPDDDEDDIFPIPVPFSDQQPRDQGKEAFSPTSHYRSHRVPGH